MRRTFHRLSVSLVVAVVLFALRVMPPAARAQSCGVSIDVGIVKMMAREQIVTEIIESLNGILGDA